MLDAFYGQNSEALFFSVFYEQLDRQNSEILIVFLSFAGQKSHFYFQCLARTQSGLDPQWNRYRIYLSICMCHFLYDHQSQAMLYLVNI